ncbi:hypothetical protein [Psychrobacter sp.]|uniref:hypothetical protein n=1 Tax=Psychrobacter sp. TaxID=56811 RepID=UPI0025DC37B1|nr:hypothetical protein [Psychrobacter sp.]
MRLVSASVLIAIGFYLMMISTMGPELTSMGEGRVDYLIRLAMVLIGLTAIMYSLLWLTWPLLKLIANRFKK